MSKKVKLLAMYLPQFHCIPENDKFWGKGFTDWVTVKNAKPLFDGHNQPRKPLNENYYDLSQKSNIEWQAQIAKEHGIYGFGIYHYWFNNEKNLLTRPSEIILHNKDIDINYFFAWDNANWKRSWSNVSGNDWAPLMEKNKKRSKGSKILIPYILGDKPDWENHYNYLKPFFKDERYIKISNCPIFIVFSYSPKIREMAAFWNTLATKDGFDGVRIIYRYQEGGDLLRKPLLGEDDCQYNYEPHSNGWVNVGFWAKLARKVKQKVHPSIKQYDYDRIWRNILKNAETRYNSSNIYHGCFVDYDDTPEEESWVP